MISEPVLDLMAVKAADSLIERKIIRGIDRPSLINLIRRALVEEMDIERKVTEEAEKLLAANVAALKGSKADLGELRRKIIQKIAAERGLVLR